MRVDSRTLIYVNEKELKLGKARRVGVKTEQCVKMHSTPDKLQIPLVTTHALFRSKVCPEHASKLSTDTCTCNSSVQDSHWRIPCSGLHQYQAMLATRLVRAAASSSTISSASAGASKLLRAKASTELTGLAVHPAPITALDETYNKTLRFLETLPKESVYRQATQALTTARLGAVQKVQERNQSALQAGDATQVESVIKELEEAIDAGQIEEVIIQAQDEFKLAAKMLEWKAYVHIRDTASQLTTLHLTDMSLLNIPLLLTNGNILTCQKRLRRTSSVTAS